MGSGYVIEHCVSTLNAIRQEDNYKFYLTEILRVISKGIGIPIKYSYYDIVKDAKKEPEQDKPELTSEEVIDSIKGKIEALKHGSIRIEGQANP